MINENNDNHPAADELVKEENNSGTKREIEQPILPTDEEVRAYVDISDRKSLNISPPLIASEDSLPPYSVFKDKVNLTDSQIVAAIIPSQHAEEKSSIFNSKFIMNKNELESFYEQNSLHHLTNNVYDDTMRLQDDMNSLMNDEKIDFPFKTPPKTAHPNDRNSSEKPLKRKKNMNNLRKELDDELTHSIFERPKSEVKPLEESPKKEDSPPKYPYKPLNISKEELYENYLDQY